MNEIVKRIKRLSATEIADSAVKLFGYSASKGSKRSVLSIPSTIIKPVNSNAVVFGPAFTVQIEENSPVALASGKMERDQSKEHFSDAIPADSVLLVSAPSHIGNAIFGGLMMTRLIKKNVPAMITNGFVRDFAELRDGVAANPGSPATSILPIFSRGLSPLPPKPFTYIKALQVPVPFPATTLDQITDDPNASGNGHNNQKKNLIYPGDFILADPNGVLVIPVEYEGKLDALVSMAEQIKEKEDKILAELKGGAQFGKTMDKHKRF